MPIVNKTNRSNALRIRSYASVHEEELNPSEYIDLFKKNRQSIKSAKYIPPKLGESIDFGKFLVKITAINIDSI